MNLLTVNVLVVRIVLQDDPDRRRLAAGLEHRGASRGRCRREETGQYQDCPPHLEYRKKQEGILTDRQTVGQTVGETDAAFVPFVVSEEAERHV